MALSSPGTQITIIDESQYLPAAPNSIPLIVFATAQNKINASGTGVAAATTAANAGKLYQVTSQRDLITYFGNPFFYKTTNGTSIQGYELNEYGLLAAYSVLGKTNLVYAIRADIDLAGLVGKTSRPSSSPDNGSWWLDTSSSTWGIYEFNASTGTFSNKTPLVVTSDRQSNGAPSDSVGTVGSYAVALGSALPGSAEQATNHFGDNPDDYSTYWYKVQDDTTSPVSSKWVAVGSPEWQAAWPAVQGTVTSASIDGVSAGNLVISMNTNTASFVGTITAGTLTVTKLNAVNGVTGSIALYDIITGTGIPDGTYITALGTGSGGTGTYTLSNSTLTLATKVAEVVGDINSSGALTVTGVNSGALSEGALLSGSVSVPSNSLTAGTSYTISTIGTTDWTALTLSAISPVTGIAAFITGATMTVTAATAGAGTGKLTSGTYLTDVTSAINGTSITSQTYNELYSGTLNGAATLVSGTNIGLTLAAAISGTFLAGDLVTANGVAIGTFVSYLGSTMTITPTTSISLGGTEAIRVYTEVKAVSAPATGLEGIYRVSKSQTFATEASPLSIDAQPPVGTTFTATASGSGTGFATQSIPAGAYISAGSGTSWTVQGITVAITGATISAYSDSMNSQNATRVLYMNGDTTVNALTGAASTVVTNVNSANIPFVTAKAVDKKLALYITKDGASINIGGDSATLGAIGLTAGPVHSLTSVFATNAKQPKWRSTDSNSRPTGSVWVKTNSSNGGLSLIASQYSTASASYVSKTVSIADSDQAANNELDSTGGKAIPLNTVYAQVGTDQAAPVQLFYRAASGASVFTGNKTGAEMLATPFVSGAQFQVQVSQPGSATLLPTDTTSYTVTLAGTTSDDFVKAWLAANISYTSASVDSVTGSIVLTHTEGGTIILDDTLSKEHSPAYDPLGTAGFSDTDIYSLSSAAGVLGAKYGPYKTVTTNGVDTTTTAAAAGLTLNIVTTGYSVDATVADGGGSYSVGDLVIDNDLGLTFKVTTISGGLSTGPVLTVDHIDGLPTPEYKVQLSNWEPFEYTSDTTAPVNSPLNGTPWYYSVINQVDLMVNVGSEWKGLLNATYDASGTANAAATNGVNNSTGIIISATEPEKQTDGTALVTGDLWLDTSDLENYPVIYRWRTDPTTSVTSWTLIDNTDQTTEDGILFADARWGSDGSIDPVNDTMPTISSLLNSDYIDLDAPDATAYPQGMILFNTRRSGYNVKKFATKYFTSANYPDAGAYDATAKTDITNRPAYEYTWVTASGNKTDGSPYMGRKAQRAMVVAAMKSTVDTSSQIREDETSFNLIVAPGYPELQPNMVSLNNDRNNTAYIIGDTPLRLADDANSITAWATNAKGATGTGEDGFVTRDTYLGVYYPSGITTDLTGAEVVVPASHMMLRTMIYNDTVAYPWFAPAGMRRGIVDNATNIGHIDAASGEFKTTKNRVALRDIEYTNMINPIAYFQNVGLLNYGNKNSFDSQSALDRTNVARLVCYIRDRLQVAVRPFLFEPNDVTTRSQIKAVISSLFADIQTKRGIYDYLVVCDESNNTPARIDRNELWIDVAIEPVKAVEFIYIPVRILNTGEIKAGA